MKTIRVFASHECAICKALTKNLSLLGLRFSLVDATAPEEQSLCDEHHVYELPHVQVLSPDGIVIWEQAGDVPLTKILRKVKDETPPPTGV